MNDYSICKNCQKSNWTGHEICDECDTEEHILLDYDGGSPDFELEYNDDEYMEHEQYYSLDLT